MSTQKKPKAAKDPMERVRKIGSRDETIEIRLTQIQIENERALIVALLDQREEIEEKKAEVVAQFKAQNATVDLQIESARRLIKSGRRHESVKIEEWLTVGNDVIRVRPDTGEILGDPRKARAEELQEKLFPDTPTPAKPAADPDQVVDTRDDPESEDTQGPPVDDDDFATPDEAFAGEPA
jgi:hypothetical protein